jgi:hypothetical protein
MRHTPALFNCHISPESPGKYICTKQNIYQPNITIAKSIKYFDGLGSLASQIGITIAYVKHPPYWTTSILIALQSSKL